VGLKTWLCGGRRYFSAHPWSSTTVSDFIGSVWKIFPLHSKFRPGLTKRSRPPRSSSARARPRSLRPVHPTAQLGIGHCQRPRRPVGVPQPTGEAALRPNAKGKARSSRRLLRPGRVATVVPGPSATTISRDHTCTRPHTHTQNTDGGIDRRQATHPPTKPTKVRASEGSTGDLGKQIRFRLVCRPCPERTTLCTLLTADCRVWADRSIVRLAGLG
jgi:hypothetical protein